MVKYLERRGFSLIRHGRRHDVFSNSVRRTQVPRHGNRELGIGLTKEILNQADIDIEEFKQEV